MPNFPGSMFIQGGTFIPDSRVNNFHRYKILFLIKPYILSSNPNTATARSLFYRLGFLFLSPITFMD